MRNTQIKFEPLRELIGYVCTTCGDRLRWNETGEHREMTDHEQFAPIYGSIKSANPSKGEEGEGKI